jgi:RNA polymerase sigma-70 factor (ECF subfamily)
MDDSDTAVLRAALNGDTDAFGILIARYHPLLFALCQRTLNDPMLAEDAAQEATLQALLSLTHLRQAERFGPWLAGIGLNVCRMWLRVRARECWSWNALPVAYIGHEGHGGDRDDPEAYAETTDLAASVRRAVAELPRGQRTAVELFYLADFSYTETAASLGIEVGAVRTRLHKARVALRENLRVVCMEETMAQDSEHKRYQCLFCGATNDEVYRMIAGPSGSAICSNCVTRCSKIIAELDGASPQNVCTFCGKTNDQVRCMVTGRKGYTVCHECVARCAELFGMEERQRTLVRSNGGS